MTGDMVERVLIGGDLKALNPDERVQYYNAVCQSLDLNPLTRPFEFIELNRKLVLYAKRECTEQLRKRDRVSVTIVSREVVDGVYVVTARATTPDGRCDESIGAVSIEGQKGEARANCIMKAETKAKRRVTLSVCGLGMLDETEAEPLAAVQAKVAKPKQQALPAPAPAPAAAAAAETKVETTAAAVPEGDGEPLSGGMTPTQFAFLLGKIKDAGSSVEKVCAHFSVGTLEDMTPTQGKEALEILKKGKRARATNATPAA